MILVALLTSVETYNFKTLYFVFDVGIPTNSRTIVVSPYAICWTDMQVFARVQI